MIGKRHPLSVGTVGWNHPEWEGSYYDPEMPEEWRFCFFSNQFRAVVVPADEVDRLTEEQAGEWVEESDPDFWFVLELLGQRLLASAGLPLQSIESAIGPLLPQTASLLVNINGLDPTRAVEVIDRIKTTHLEVPVCIDDPREILDGGLLVESGVSRCWRPARENSPLAGRGFLVALCEGMDLKAMRGVVESLLEWSEGGDRAGLFFTDPHTATHQAEQGRILADLLG